MINIDQGQIISDPPRRNFLLVYPGVPSLSTTLQGIVVAPTLKMDLINQGTRNHQSRRRARSAPPIDDPAELPDIRPSSPDCCCMDCDAVEHLRLRISESLSVSDDLRLQLSAAQTKINHAHSRIVRRLAPEIMSLIFESCVADPKWEAFPHKSSTVPPLAQLTIGAVCRTWRQIAWSSPQLWTTIAFNPRQRGLLRQIDRARDWLSRSGELPLTIKMTTRNGHERQVVWKAAFTLLNGYYTRWKYVDLNLPDYLLQYLPDGTCHASPMIERFRVNALFGIADSDPSPMCAFQDVSSKWTHVTHACLSYISIDQALELLSLAPQLQDLKVKHAMETKDQSSLPEQPIEHQLLCLTVSEETGDFVQFFEHVLLPRLVKLDCDSNSPTICEALIAFLSRSHSPLLVLYFHGTSNQRKLAELFSLTPSLVEMCLILDGGSDPDNILQMLADTSLRTSDDQTQALLPALRSLQFWPDERFSWKSFVNIFGPLNDLHNPLRRPLRVVQLILDESIMSFLADEDDELFIPLDDLKSIMGLIQEGISINIRTTEDDEPADDLGHDVIALSMAYHFDRHGFELQSDSESDAGSEFSASTSLIYR
ncbi:hypothetical protein CVT26_015262 [Gymnopilus dilepis]|uniref:Uncharacterized protein n=1 Tax=Gymnopilus dilepis TaxID=231916 RepID=A0A409W9X6_9AGAR|nr:hypothetical protein CVT26_015262 [Gymnopilus dilepis]